MYATLIRRGNEVFSIRRLPALVSRKNEAAFMNTASRGLVLLVSCILVTQAANVAIPEEPAAAAPKAFIDGTGLGWRALGEADFVMVNGDPETWTWKDGSVHCTG